MTQSSDNRQTPVRSAKYQLLLEIGRGGMGVVHLAMTRGPQGFVKLVVLKMLQPQLLGNSTAQRMFLEEARISARLAHPNIVQVYEVIEHSGVPTMVMEYLEGQPLATVLRDDPSRLPLHLHLLVLSRVLAGLHAAHELRDYDGTPLNLIHRDVSPHNVFLMFDGQVKVLDFGIAKAAGRSELETETGELKGKIRYMAPEQLVGERLDRRADVFAVGVMLWEALAGQRLWRDMNDGEVMRCLLNGQVPELPQSARMTPGLAAVCAKSLSTEVSDRYATAGEFQRDLERQLEQLPQVAKADDLSAWMVEHFGQARESANRLIDAHIKAADRASNRPAAESSSQDLLTLVDTTTPRRAGRRRRQRRNRIIAAVSAAALLLAAVGVVQWERGRRASRATADRGPPPRPGMPSEVTDPAQAGSCAPGFKWCRSECVSIDRPDVGCGSDECIPCFVPNATARCNLHHECDIAVCYQDHNNCDG
ncbi:MAG TPA: serine/threonine-protein kinase, partial [Polyangiaceae bacterium]|nr:serine/threonine-protein kinase [Polyangiaceae bacterium]